MKIIPNIPTTFTGKFPKGYINDVNGWAFTAETIENNVGKLLTLDIDFDNKCTLNCPHCFRRNNSADHGKHKIIQSEEMQKIIIDAKKLGLKTVKFLGAGEPLESHNIIDFLKFLKNQEIIPLLFTKGHIIGDDAKVQENFSKYGVKTGMELAHLLYDLNVSILLGFNAFDDEVQDKMVGGINGFTKKRNLALENLVRAGFSKGNPTRLCLAANPVTNDNYQEVFEIYKWGRERNMYVIVCPTMISGRCGDKGAWEKINPSADKLVKLYTDIYKFNIKKGIQTYLQIKNEGIASYAGGHPCNQVSCGMYITLQGIVIRCPGSDEESTIFGDVRKESIKDIWIKSENYGRSGMFNCGCPPKWGRSIPYNLFTDVMLNLRKIYG